MSLLEELKARIGDRVAAAIGDPALEAFLATIATDYPDAGRGQTLDLAQAECCLRMASDASLWFKYSQGSESVDKTTSADQFLALARVLWAKHGVERGSGDAGLVTVHKSEPDEDEDTD